ncbi:MAG TPA: YceI family protein [Enhygromyxa sp.]|nr:YceI family protein [Enhygromyxa sp.]
MSLSLALASVAACKSEVDDKPKAKVEDAGKVEAQPKPETNTEAKTLSLAGEGSSIGFIGAKITGDHKGSFTDFKGSATVEGDKLNALEIVVGIGSMKSDDDQLTGHLLSADFFEAETYPEAKFTSLSITEKSGEGGATHEVVGNLELKGQTKKITFPATIHVKDGSVHGKAAFSIDRTLWGITYPGKPEDLIKNDVALELELSFKA